MVTKVSYKLDKNNNFKSVIIQGHTDYAEKGKDIVCAAISAITNGTVNFLHEYYPTDCQITYFSTNLNIQLLTNNPDCQLSLKLMLYQLKNIADDYSNYLEFAKNSIKSL